MLALIIILVVAAFLVVLGILMRKGKGLMLLAGYNTMPKEARARLDKTIVSKMAGSLLIRMGIYFALLGIGSHFSIGWLSVLMLVLVIADSFISTILMMRKTGLVATQSKGWLIATAIICAVVLVFVGVLLYDGSKEPEIYIEGGIFKITSMYGTDIALSEISSVTLDERSMFEIAPAMVKTNGYDGFDDVRKGSFKSEKLGNFVLFVHGDSMPTLKIERHSDAPIFISLKNEADTRALYKELQSAIK